MTRTQAPDLAADLAAANQRVEQARAALRAAIEDKVQALAAINEARVPADLREHMARIAQAGELTPEEQTERDEAQAAYDNAVAAEGPTRAALAALARGIDPKDGSPRPEERFGQKRPEDQVRQDRIKYAKQDAERELGYADEVTAAARRGLNAIVRRQDQARQARRVAVKQARSAAEEEQRRLNKPRRFAAFDFIRKALT